jgi:hypothetical protein
VEEDADEFIGHEPTKARGLAALSAEEKERIVGEVVRYLVFSESAKSLTARQDISKAVLAPEKKGSLLTPLLPLAAEKLKSIFGWELIQVPIFTPKGKFSEESKNHMILRRTPELESFMAPVIGELSPKPNMGFLMIVLSIIMMHNFSIEEELVLTNLEKFGLDKNVALAQFDGKTSLELIKELAKLGYLSIKREKEGVETTTNLNIGPRSLLEIGKVNILRFVNEICKTEIDQSALREFTAEQREYNMIGAGVRMEANRLAEKAREGAAAVAMAAQRLENDEDGEEDEPPAANGRANGRGGGGRGAKNTVAAAPAAPMEVDAEANGNGHGRPAPRRAARRGARK